MNGKISNRITNSGLLAIVLVVSLISQIPASHAEVPRITVKGKFLFHPDGSPYNSEPIKGAKVEVWDAEPWPFPAELLASGSTDDHGVFEFTDISNDDGIIEGGRDVYVKVYAKNGAVDVVTNPIWLFGHTYSFQTETKNNVEPGTVNFGTKYVPNQDHGAWEIQNHLQIARDFLESQTGLKIPRVRAFYKDAFSPAASYYYGGVLPAIGFIPSLPFGIAASELSGIHYSETNFVEDGQIRIHEVIFHEYGHYVQDYYADFWPPFTELLHDGHTAYNPEHAFVEGWAEYFSAAARQWAGFNETEYRDYPDVETNVQGDDVELSIAGVFWDIHDSEDESLDDISLGFFPIWRILTDYDPDTILSWPIGSDHPWDIYTFWELYKNNNAGDESIGGVWKILSLHGIDIPDDTPPENPTTFTSPHEIGVGSQNDKVWVFWEGASDDVSGISNYAVCWTPSDYWDPTGPKPSPFGWDEYFDTYVTDNFASSPRLPPGEWWLHLKTKDNAGNWGEVVNVGPFVILEKISPITSLISEAEIHVDYEGKLYISQGDLLSFNVTDPFLKDPDRSYYRIVSGGYDSGSKEYSTAFRLNELSDGEYSFRFWTTSKIGEVYKEPANTLSIVLDSTPPTTTHTIGSPSFSDLNTTYIDGSTEIQLHAVDSSSGVASTMYRITGSSYDSSWLAYGSPFTLTLYSSLEERVYEVLYKSVDNVGNEEPVNAFSVHLRELDTQADFTWSSEATDEGSLIYFTDLSESFPGSIASWTWDFGDGTTTGTANPTHVYADNGSYNVSLQATDENGLIDSLSYVIGVGNAPPEVDAGSDLVADEGAPVSLSPAIFSDGGSLDNHTAVIDWGDGTAPESRAVSETPYGPPGSTAGVSGTVSGVHVYADDGVFTVNVTVTDDDGASAYDTFSVTVNNLDPEVSAGPDRTVRINELVTFSADFSDSGTLDSHSATWSWGDASDPEAGNVSETPQGPPGSEEGMAGAAAGSHAYSEPGVYTVTLTVADDDGGAGADGLLVMVLPYSDVTDSDLDPDFDKEPEEGRQFRLIYTNDPRDWGKYRLTASNPGQFYYNVFHLGTAGDELNISIEVPYPFVTKGVVPVHVYGSLDIVDGRYVPDGLLHEIPATLFLDPAGGRIDLELQVPESGLLYVTVHLDYGLKKVSGYVPRAYGRAVQQYETETYPDVLDFSDPDYEPHAFRHSVDDGSGPVYAGAAQEIMNRNIFKNDPGFFGFVLDAGDESPVEGAEIAVFGPDGGVIGTTYTDENGYYFLYHKHTGKEGVYTVIQTDSGLLAECSMKANKFVETDFFV